MAAQEGASLRARLRAHLTSWWFWGTMTAFLAAFIVMISLKLWLQWFWILLYAALVIPWCPVILEPALFFKGGMGDTAKGAGNVIILAGSVSISWVFAKSILNASTLSASYGIVGGLGYAGYYMSFPAVGIVVYFMRTRKGYKSLPEAIQQRYGTMAAVAFGAAVLFRLYQEVWSNALVVAGFYGPVHSTEWWLAACLSTAVPVIYSVTGGMRASLMTDVGQSFVCIAFLLSWLIVLGVNALHSFGTWNPAGTCTLSNPAVPYAQCAAFGGAQVANGAVVDSSKALFKYTNASCNYATIAVQPTCEVVGGKWTPQSCSLGTELYCENGGGTWKARDMWSLKGGLDFLLLALIQGCLSYPFFDPVLTDRAFLAAPKTMVVAFILGGALAGSFILLFGFTGIFGSMQTSLDPASVPGDIFQAMFKGQPSAVSKFFGTAAFSIVNIIFITESLSTLDSTFTSAAKLMGPEFFGLLEDGRPRPPEAASKRQLFLGRVVIIILAVAGILPLLSDPAALDATTVSGTVVMGLGPPVFALMFIDGHRPLTFHLPFWWGVAMGIVYQLSTDACCRDHINTSGFAMGDGNYAVLLGFNVIGAAGAWGLMLLTLLENPFGSKLAHETWEGNNVVKMVRGLTGRTKGSEAIEDGSGPSSLDDDSFNVVDGTGKVVDVMADDDAARKDVVAVV